MAASPRIPTRWAGATTRTWTWERFRNDVLDLAAGLIDHDVAGGARVAIMLPNRVEHLVADAAAVHAGCVPVSIYPTLSSEQIAEVVGACSPSVLVVESDADLARWRPANRCIRYPAHHRPRRDRHDSGLADHLVAIRAV
jgi:long-chain acyl-CoA synthetase